MKKKTQEKLVSPSEFMRQLRPGLYSDSTIRDQHQLKAEILSHHLDTITERNETHDFELFCRKLCERAICPNLRPATGPEGGGDSKADTETTPVADEISKLYCGLANSGSERWAFAFSAKKTWADKARSDVAGIIATNRGYEKIFFVTSRAARAKDRARVEQELTEKYGVAVIIHDRGWIVDEVIDKNRRDLAYNYLGIGDKTSERELGPSDYSRKQQLEDVEKELTDPTAFTGMEMQRAAEALVAAKLARELELPRTDVDGKFTRAIRLADDGGTQRQQLTARYEALWTAFWWFDDIKAVVDGYDAFEALVIGGEHAKNLEMLCNLAQLLFNIVVHGHLSEEEAGLKARIDRLSSRLSELASDLSRPNNALEARTSLLTIEVNEAMRAGDPKRLASLWPQFSDLMVKAEGMGEFDVNRLTRLVEVFGQVAGKDRGYRDLVDQTSEFVTKRTGESAGALILLKRAGQLDFDENMEMIRLLGKAARLLTKKEHADDLVNAQAQLSLGYRSAGLLWAARASCTSAVATLFIEGDEEGELSPTIFPLLMNAAWQAVELKHLPEVLQIIQIARGCLSSLPYDEAALKRADEQLQDFDLILACQLANLPAAVVPRLEMLPAILAGLGLIQSRATLLYVLGYEEVLRDEGWIPDTEVEAVVRKKWDAHHANWLVTPQEAAWPFTVVLHDLTERDVCSSLGSTREWVQAWRAWDPGSCTVEWTSRRWSSGDQELPMRLVIPSADAAAAILGQKAGWERAKRRYARWCEWFPHLAGSRAVARQCDAVLVDYSEEDFERFGRLLQWLLDNPRSALYLRQLPVPDVDTKWVEKRRGAVTDLARHLLGAPEAASLHEACGLRTEPSRMRIRVLCPLLRAQVGGLCDIEAPGGEPCRSCSSQTDWHRSAPTGDVGVLPRRSLFRRVP